MRLKMNERRTLIKVFREQYLKANRTKKGLLLDEFVALTGYNRNYAARALRHQQLVRPVRKKRPGRVTYGNDVRDALEKIWTILDYVCGKRLVAVLPDVLERLIERGEISVSSETRRRLQSISPATADRLLAGARYRLGRRRRGSSNPMRQLFSQIPIKTFGEWKGTPVGFLQMDLVAHNGGNVAGGHLWTINSTDVASAWTHAAVVANKTEFQVLKGLLRIKRGLPFPWLGAHTDNGSEFINGTAVAFFDRLRIKFTRSRPYRKNDACYIEQKNNSIVRRNVGYLRYEKKHYATLVELYRDLNLYTNFFQPAMILTEKKRVGAKVYRKYDRPQTPYQRLQKCSKLSRKQKQSLKQIFDSLNPAELRRNIDRLQSELIEMGKQRPRKKLNTERQRRPRRDDFLEPARRRDDYPHGTNTFTDKVRMFRLRRDAKKLWAAREKDSNSG